MLCMCLNQPLVNYDTSGKQFYSALSSLSLYFTLYLDTLTHGPWLEPLFDPIQNFVPRTRKGKEPGKTVIQS